MASTDHKIYNTIGYISFILGIICVLIIINKYVSYIDIQILGKYEKIMPIIGGGFIMIYHKIHTIPITEAIANYWKYKIKKQNKNTAQDYASFKKEENENDK